MIKKILASCDQIPTIFSSLPFNSKKKVESPYGVRLRESRALRLVYGKLSPKYLQKIFQKSENFANQTLSPIFTILESRLDVVLYRSGFFESIPSAKQFVLSGRIAINKKRVVSPATLVVPGDLIQILAHSTQEIFSGCSTFKEARWSCLNQSTEKKSYWRFKSSLFLPSFTRKSPIEIISKAFEEKARIEIPLRKLYHQDEKQKKKWVKTNFESESVKANNLLVDIKSGWLSSPKHKRSLCYTSAKLLQTSYQASYKYKAELCKKLCTCTVRLRQQACEGFDFARKKESDSMGMLSVRKEALLKQLDLLLFLKYKLFLRKQLLSSLFLYRPETPFVIGKSSSSSFVPFAPTGGRPIGQRKEGESSFSLTTAGKEKASFSFADVSGSANERRREKSSLARRTTSQATFSKADVKEACGKAELKTQTKFASVLLSINKKFDKKKAALFLEQKSNLFFKEQAFFEQKKSKALHLEISYKTLSIIVLFSPQRITLPAFIDVSKIYK